jgi:hypothetical protein
LCLLLCFRFFSFFSDEPIFLSEDTIERQRPE